MVSGLGLIVGLYFVGKVLKLYIEFGIVFVGVLGIFVLFFCLMFV